MRATNSLARWGLAACLVGSASLVQAQETGFTKEFKLRFGYAMTPKDHLRGEAEGFGLNLGWGMGTAGKIALELGYFYKTGDNFYTLADGSKLPAAGFEPYIADLSKSAEDKRNEFSGFAVRLSYQNKLDEKWDWQAGLQMGAKFKHQYVGDVRSTNWGGDWNPASADSWRDLYNGTPVEGGLNISPYLGVNYNFDKDSSLEMNILFLRYNAIEYKHYAGTASSYDPGYPGWSVPPYGRVSSSSTVWQYDRLEENSRMVPHIEFAYVFHF